MSRRPRRNHTPAFETKVALAAITGDRTLAQLAEHFPGKFIVFLDCINHARGLSAVAHSGS
jgi:hypothetical protein